MLAPAKTSAHSQEASPVCSHRAQRYSHLLGPVASQVSSLPL